MDELDRSRIEEFRQLKKEIRRSEKHLIVGIDIAKNKHNAFFATATGKTLLKRLVFENNQEGFSRLLTYAEGERVKAGLEEVVFGLEPTANYHKPLGEHLVERGQKVVLVSGLAVDKNRQLLDGRWDKNDTKDPANIADLISQGKFLYYDHPVMPLRDLRNLLSLKRRLKKQEHGIRVRIRNHLLAQYYPEMDGLYGKSDTLGLSIVKWCLAPEVMANLEYEAFVKTVTGGRRLTLGQKENLREIWEKAPYSIGCKPGETLGFEAKLMVDQLQQIKETIELVDGKILQVCLKFPEYNYLLSIPGFGPDVSSKVLAAIGNPFRFNSVKQLIKMAGLDLSARRSGEKSESVVGRISKRGNASLRYALYQAAQIASTRNEYFVTYFTNKLRGREREQGIKTKMRVKLSAKLLVIAWTIMKKGEPFNPGYLEIG